jgi:hypothetical protein
MCLAVPSLNRRIQHYPVPASLKCPTSTKLAGSRKSLIEIHLRNVLKIGIANRRGLVSLKHRIDSFRELRAGAFVNATRVDPKVVVSVGFCDSSTFANIEVSQLLVVGSVAHLLVSDL